MKRVVIESPYAGDVAANMGYLQDCIKDCLARGETPYASHMMLTLALDDLDAEQRALGIEAGWPWAEAADYVVVYTDHGISKGMAQSITEHTGRGRQIYYRELKNGAR